MLGVVIFGLPILGVFEILDELIVKSTEEMSVVFGSGSDVKRFS